MKLNLDQIQLQASRYDWSFPQRRYDISWCDVEQRCASQLISQIQGEEPQQQNEREGLRQYLQRECIHCQCLNAPSGTCADYQNWWILNGKMLRTTELRVRFHSKADVIYCSPEKIEEQLKLLLKLSAAPLIDPPVVSAWLSYLIFIRTHPFMDGNGRAARALFCHSLHRWTRSDQFVHPIGPYMRIRRAEILPRMNAVESAFDLVSTLHTLHVVFLQAMEYMELIGQGSDSDFLSLFGRRD